MKHIDTHYADNGRFKNRNAYKGTPGTVIDDSWLNSLQDEVINFITEAGITLDEADNKQLLKALDVLTKKTMDTYLGENADGIAILAENIKKVLTDNMQDVVNNEHFVASMEEAIKRTTTTIINEYLRTDEGRDIIFNGAVSVVEEEAAKAEAAAASAISSKTWIDTKMPTIAHSSDEEYKSAIAVPAGTTAERGESAVALFRYNTELKRFEGCDGNKWGGISGGGINEFTTQTVSFTIEPTKGYFVETDKSEANLTVSLLDDNVLENGASVAIGDYSGRAYDNPFTISPAEGTTINGRGDFTFDIDYAVLNLTYIKSKKDWRVTSAVGESTPPSFVSRQKFFDSTQYTVGDTEFGIPDYALTPSQVDVFHNAGILIEDIDYTVSSLGTIKLTYGMGANDTLLIRGYNRVQHASIDRLEKQVNQLTNPNLFINGNFSIWQRGTSFTNPNGYTADCWIARNFSSIKQTRHSSIEAYAMAECPVVCGFSTVGITNNIQSSLDQRIEEGCILLNKTVTLSWLCSANETNGYDTIEAVQVINFNEESPSLTIDKSEFTFSGDNNNGAWVWGSVTFKVPPETTVDGGILKVRVVFKNGISGWISQLKLERSAFKTPFVNDVNANYLACLRFYWYCDIAQVAQMLSSDGAGGTYTKQCVVDFPVPMYKPPVIDVARTSWLDSGDSNWKNITRGGYTAHWYNIPVNNRTQGYNHIAFDASL